ncbi:MAG: cytochrome P450 [Acidimicrobiaceae bacterium]|nr:cytochrome P450 [Acidimicrobiaceae bacterium]
MHSHIDFDPFDPAQRDRHHEVMAELRDACPVARVASGMVVVSRYDDVRSALNVPTMRNSHAARAPGVAVPPEDRLFFFEYDPPEHPALRRLMVDVLSRQRAAQMTPTIRALVEELLQPIVRAGGGELVQQLSVPLAGRLMMLVAGFPETDASCWRQWIKDMVVSGFSFTNRNARGVGFAQCYPELLAYLDEQIEARAEVPDPPDDVLTRVLRARIDGEALGHNHRRMILFSVVSAGTNTLVNFLSNTCLSLALDEALVEALRKDRSLVPIAVEESLRRDAPSMYLTRRCVEPTEVAGSSVAEGDKLLLGLASANRDWRAYPDPDEFRLDRHGQPPHMAFGWGSHLCLGAPIARQTGSTFLDVLLDAVDTIHLEPGEVPVPYLSPQGNGLDELKVVVTP